MPLFKSTVFFPLCSLGGTSRTFDSLKRDPFVENSFVAPSSLTMCLVPWRNHPRTSPSYLVVLWVLVWLFCAPSRTLFLQNARCPVPKARPLPPLFMASTFFQFLWRCSCPFSPVLSSTGNSSSNMRFFSFRVPARFSCTFFFCVASLFFPKSVDSRPFV